MRQTNGDPTGTHRACLGSGGQYSLNLVIVDCRNNRCDVDVDGNARLRQSANGRQIFRAGGRLTLADGTLAGADIALIDAVRHVHLTLGLPLTQALQLAGANAAKAMGLPDRGHLRPGARADFFCLTPDITAKGCWIAGEKVA